MVQISRASYQIKSNLFKRYENNPILTPEMWPYEVNSVFNAGAAMYNNKVLLLLRVEDRRGFSHFSKAVSADGLTNWEIDKTPTMMPERDKYPEDNYGIEDPRIVKLENLNVYAIVFTSFSKSGPLVSLATTIDFNTFKRIGIICPPDDKDASLFPDLVHWGNSGILVPARKGSWWDAYKIGLGPPPIETKEGWLIIYHGVKTTAAGALYRLGLVLLDLEDPTKVIKRCDEWVFGPNELYERIGDVPDVTFPCGVVVRGDELIMYYGAADTTLCVATASVKELLDYILNSKTIYDKTDQ